MKYQFPEITELKDIMPAIRDSKEFLVVDRGPYKIVNYVVVTNDTFPPVVTSGGSEADRLKNSRLKALRRECRGLIFDRNNKLVSRPYHKFFNMDERAETLKSNVDLSQPHIVLEKLDGSMVRPFYVGKDIRWATRMGITGVAMEAELFVAKNPIYNDFAKDALDLGYTPIFEWLSKDNPIVISHSEDKLVLTGVRHMFTGHYLPYLTLEALAANDQIPVVGKTSIDEIEANKDDFEGIVIRFDDGHMIKVKTEWYVLRHKSRDMITREKDILSVIFNDELDDIKPFLTEEDRVKLDAFATRVNENVLEYANSLTQKIIEYRKQVKGDRKRFALEIAPNLHGHDKGIIFKAWDDLDFNVLEALENVIRSQLGSKEKVESVRRLFGGIRWGDK